MMESSRLSAAQQRRTKRLVPDTEKDETYWEKRKRNNIAAKKSRENKRQYECMVRGRIDALEEENSLLKKELDVIKEKFNIPKDICVLSSSERDECLEACWKTQNATNRSPRSSPEVPSTSLNVSSYSSFEYDLEDNQNEDTGESLVNSDAHVNNYVWAVTPAHSQSLQRFAEGSRIYRNEMSYDHTSEYNKRKRDSFSYDDDMTPADLSTKRNPNTYTENNEPLPCRDLGGFQRIPERAQTTVPGNLSNESLSIRSSTHSFVTQSNPGEHSNKNLHENDDIVVDSTEEDMTNSDIKNKLQLLSDQVERMQKLVCNTSA